ncbi:MAG: Uma2 family endonuclease [Cyanobacteria bacterium J06614_10]
MVAATLKQFTADEYHRMSEAGILLPAERTELVEGNIIETAAKSAAHAAAVFLTHRLLAQQIANAAFVRSQEPIRLSDISEPEPDISVVRPGPLAYSTQHPSPADVLLIVEVSSFSLQYDQETKAPLYATAKIADYWILDILKRELHLYRQPKGDRYQSHTILTEALSVSPLAFSHLTIQITDLLPPQPSADSDNKS